MVEKEYGKYRISLFGESLSKREGVLFENWCISKDDVLKELKTLGVSPEGYVWVVENLTDNTAKYTIEGKNFLKCKLGDYADLNIMPLRSFSALYAHENNFSFLMSEFKVKTKIHRFEVGAIYPVPGKITEFYYIDSKVRVSRLSIAKLGNNEGTDEYVLLADPFSKDGKRVDSDYYYFIKNLSNFSLREVVKFGNKPEKSSIKKLPSQQAWVDEVRSHPSFYKKSEGYTCYQECLGKIYNFERTKVVNKNVFVDIDDLTSSSFKGANDFKRFSDAVKLFKIKKLKVNSLYRRLDGKGFFSLVANVKYKGFSFNEFFIEEVFSYLGTLLYYRVRGIYSCSSVSSANESSVCGIFHSKQECSDFISKKFFR